MFLCVFVSFCVSKQIKGVVSAAKWAHWKASTEEGKGEEEAYTDRFERMLKIHGREKA